MSARLEETDLRRVVWDAEGEDALELCCDIKVEEKVGKVAFSIVGEPKEEEKEGEGEDEAYLGFLG